MAISNVAISPCVHAHHRSITRHALRLFPPLSVLPARTRARTLTRTHASTQTKIHDAHTCTHTQLCIRETPIRSVSGELLAPPPSRLSLASRTATILTATSMATASRALWRSTLPCRPPMLYRQNELAPHVGGPMNRLLRLSASASPASLQLGCRTALLVVQAVARPSFSHGSHLLPCLLPSPSALRRSGTRRTSWQCRKGSRCTSTRATATRSNTRVRCALRANAWRGRRASKS